MVNEWLVLYYKKWIKANIGINKIMYHITNCALIHVKSLTYILILLLYHDIPTLPLYHYYYYTIICLPYYYYGYIIIRLCFILRIHILIHKLQKRETNSYFMLWSIIKIFEKNYIASLVSYPSQHQILSNLNLKTIFFTEEALLTLTKKIQINKQLKDYYY